MFYASQLYSFLNFILQLWILNLIVEMLIIKLQMFENTPETKSTTATNASIGCGTSDRTKSVGACGKKISSDVGQEGVDMKDRANISAVESL